VLVFASADPDYFISHVDDEGYGTVTEQRPYQLIRQPQPIADRLFG
jgi:hypothetical protein